MPDPDINVLELKAILVGVHTTKEKTTNMLE